MSARKEKGKRAPRFREGKIFVFVFALSRTLSTNSYRSRCLRGRARRPAAPRRCPRRTRPGGRARPARARRRARATRSPCRGRRGCRRLSIFFSVLFFFGRRFVAREFRKERARARLDKNALARAMQRGAKAVAWGETNGKKPRERSDESRSLRFSR